MDLVSLRKGLVQYKLGKETKDLRWAFSDSIRSLPTRVSIGRFDWWVTPHRHQNSPEIMGIMVRSKTHNEGFRQGSFLFGYSSNDCWIYGKDQSTVDNS